MIHRDLPAATDQQLGVGLWDPPGSCRVIKPLVTDNLRRAFIPTAGLVHGIAVADLTSSEHREAR